MAATRYLWRHLHRSIFRAGTFASQRHGEDCRRQSACSLAGIAGMQGSIYTNDIADAQPAIAEAANVRLVANGAPVSIGVGHAVDTVNRIVERLNKHALHFAFLDPCNLESLPFEVIRKLASLESMDILIHVSIQDLQRNLPRYIRKTESPLDSFVPHWREHVDVSRAGSYVRPKIFEYWRALLKTVGIETAEAAELVTGSNNQPLYWLAFAARHPRALEFWEKIRDIDGSNQRSLF